MDPKEGEIRSYSAASPIISPAMNRQHVCFWEGEGVEVVGLGGGGGGGGGCMAVEKFMLHRGANPTR